MLRSHLISPPAPPICSLVRRHPVRPPRPQFLLSPSGSTSHSSALRPAGTPRRQAGPPAAPLPDRKLLGGADSRVFGIHIGRCSRIARVREALPALMQALDDRDGDVRAWAAQTIGEIGPEAKVAVSLLLTLLRNGDEGSRNSSCIALGKIGPAAKDALPALRQALNDPSNDVRRFAEQAIENIQK